jgi:hypothetical protein
MTACSDCLNLHQCRWLLKRTGKETSCDWEPSRFRQKSSELLAIEAKIAARHRKEVGLDD